MAVKKLLPASKKGFTLIEFLLSSAIFSFFLVIVMIGFMQINRSYNRGLTVKSVQQSARIIVEDISRTIANNPGQVTFLEPDATNPSSPDSFRMCIDTVKYSWNGVDSNMDYTDEAYTDDTAQFILVKSNVGDSCEEAPSIAGAKSLVSGSMNNITDSTDGEGDGDLVIQYLSIEPVPDLEGVYIIDLVLSTDDEALTNRGIDANCSFTEGDAGGEAAKQYCSVITMTTSVSSRR